MSQSGEPHGDVLASGAEGRRGSPWVGRVAVAVVVLVLAAGWFADDLADLLRDRVAVPRAGDMPVAEAVERLRDAGLAPEIEERFAACWPARWVLDQDPEPGTTVDPGTTVVLSVSDASSTRTACPEGVATENDRALAARFIAFAQEPGPLVELRWADEVEVVARGRDEVVSGEAAQQESTWQTDDGYLLAGAMTLGDSWLVQAAEERRCPDPASLEQYRRLAVSDTDPTGAPDRRFDDCRPGSAFSLYVDGDYRIHGVQVLGR